MFPSVRSRLFASHRRATQLHAYGSPRFLLRESVGHPCGCGLIQVVLDFVVDILVGGGFVEEHAETVGKLPPERHAASPPLSRRGQWRMPGGPSRLSQL